MRHPHHLPPALPLRERAIPLSSCDDLGVCQMPAVCVGGQCLRMGSPQAVFPSGTTATVTFSASPTDQAREAAQRLRTASRDTDGLAERLATARARASALAAQQRASDDNARLAKRHTDHGNYWLSTPAELAAQAGPEEVRYMTRWQTVVHGAKVVAFMGASTAAIAFAFGFSWGRLGDHARHLVNTLATLANLG